MSGGTCLRLRESLVDGRPSRAVAHQGVGMQPPPPPLASVGQGGVCAACELRYVGPAAAVEVPSIEGKLRTDDNRVARQSNETRFLQRIRHPNAHHSSGRFGTERRRPRGLGVGQWCRPGRLHTLLAPPSTRGGVQASRSLATRLRVLTDIAVALRYSHLRIPCAVLHGDIQIRSFRRRLAPLGRATLHLANF